MLNLLSAWSVMQGSSDFNDTLTAAGNLLAGLYPAGVVGTIITMILTGMLITRKAHREQLDILQRNADKWEKAYDQQALRADLAEKTLYDHIMTTGAATTHALMSLPTSQQSPIQTPQLPVVAPPIPQAPGGVA